MEEFIAVYKEKGYVAFGLMPKYVWYLLIGLLLVLVGGSFFAALIDRHYSKR